MQEKIASRKVLSLASWIADKYSKTQEAFREIQLKSQPKDNLIEIQQNQMKTENLTREIPLEDNFTDLN